MISPAPPDDLALAIQRFIDQWVPKRLYSTAARMACLADLLEVIALAEKCAVERASAEPAIEIPHEGTVD